MTIKSWFSIKASGERCAEILIYDEIGIWGITAADFANKLNGLDVDTIVLRLNTPGGSVFDGNAIANALDRHQATVEVHIDGLAASMGSIIALAGDSVQMAENALYMIHYPWTLAVGNADDLRGTADVLDKLGEAMVNTYMSKTSQTAEQINEWLAAETWFTADEALDAGFIDSVEEGLKAAAFVDVAKFNFKNAPETLTEQPEADPDGAETNSHLARKFAARRTEMMDW